MVIWADQETQVDLKQCGGRVHISQALYNNCHIYFVM